MEKISRKELVEALFDVLDGNSKWHDIRDITGLDEKRCKEISKFYDICKRELGYDGVLVGYNIGEKK